MRVRINGEDKPDILTHWVWALPILLIVAFLSIRQIDLYPPETDEFHSMYASGWMFENPVSPMEIILSLYENSPEHAPGFFLLLDLWGKVTTFDLAIGRVFGVFCGLLSLAMAFRLARDFVAPIAGLFAIIIVASNAFYSFYIPHVRMYSLVVLVSGIALWLYLRIVHQSRVVRNRDHLALFVAVFALVYTHVFSLTLLLTLGIYHLLIVPKNRKWWTVSVTVSAAVLLFSPYLTGTATIGLRDTVAMWGSVSADGIKAIEIWLTVASNNQAGLMLLSMAGLALGVWKKKTSPQPIWFLALIFLAGLGLIAEFTPLVSKFGMRYHLVGLFPLVLLFVAGLSVLYGFRKKLGLLLLLWIVAGLSFQMTADWRQYLSTGRVSPFSLPPYHAISRMAVRSEHKAHIFGFPYHPVAWAYGYGAYTHQAYYFENQDINLTLTFTADKDTLEHHLRWNAQYETSLWVFYQTSAVDPEHVSEVDAVFNKLNYQLCAVVEVGVDTVIRQYSWVTFDCSAPRPLGHFSTEIIDYQFTGAQLDEASSKLYFSDQWTATEDESLDNLRISHQLISPEWDNVAQLDLPLVHQGKPRQFYINVNGVPAGSYRLMAILYDKNSGERVTWIDNDNAVPELLVLEEIIVPELD